MRFDGRSWSRPVSIDASSADELSAYGLNGLTGVSCATDTFCMGVDQDGRSFVYHGTNWSQAKYVEPPSIITKTLGTRKAGIVGVSCPTSSFCAAVTVLGGAVTFNGSTWSIKGKAWSTRHVLEPARLVGQATGFGFPSIADVSCPSSTFCVAVSAVGDASTFNGRSWSSPNPIDSESVTTGNGSGLTAVSCSSSTFCVAVDGSGDAVIFDGTRWSAPEPIDPSLGLTSVSCSAANFCVALDDIGDALTYNGQSWSSPRQIDR
jgi:hypothetical protein